MEASLSEVRETKNIPPVKSFETERGSIYSYDNEGKVARYKTIENKVYKEDLTTFVTLNQEQSIKVVDAISSEKFGVYIVEAGDSGVSNYVYKREDVKNVDKLRFVVIDIPENKCVFSKKASLTPIVGDTVYEVSESNDKKNTFIRHLGHKVTKINY